MTIHVGNVLDILPTLPDQSVHCCITSPPYWGLRDYGTAQWEGGDAACDHTATRRGHSSDEKQATSAGTSRDSLAGATVCRCCGARRIDSQLGLEATPDEYVANMVAVFREVRRVLRDDGTLWLNLGDSYASGEIGRHDGRVDGSGYGARLDGARQQARLRSGLKPKDLVGIPWRVAFALQADGWYLRSDIIWSKPNPMPESVRDRPTKAHEYVFLMSKSERYWYDAAAIADATQGRERFGNSRVLTHDDRNDCTRRDMQDNWTRNRRTVWTIATQPYPEAHFATYPEKLVEPCVLAGCPAGGTVLDPFCGSGTTGAVAYRLGRQFVGIELNPEYAAMAERRIAPHRDQLQLVVTP